MMRERGTEGGVKVAGMAMLFGVVVLLATSATTMTAPLLLISL